MADIDVLHRDPVIVWFRNDLRLSDNPALMAAHHTGRPVIAVYILDDEAAGQWSMGGASRWWLHQSLTALNASLTKSGGWLNVFRGDSASLLKSLIDQTGAKAVFWNRRYEPWAIAQDRNTKLELTSAGLEVRSFNASLLVEPWNISNKQGKHFKVFTPFWKTIQASHHPDPALPAPTQLNFADFKGGVALDRLELEPKKPDWAGGLRAFWQVGETEAQTRLAEFLDSIVVGYKVRRNIPAQKTTSRLSPHLRFGEISPRQIWHAVNTSSHGDSNDAYHFLSEIAWREFSYHLLYHFPDLAESNFQNRFDRFDWLENSDGLKAWSKGLTGFPIVDAGMRELWHTGWMHNRVRMIVASFLTKDLMIHWKHGQDWFWDTLVDADLANNAAGWQWTAGSGADAAPYFRVFNPVTQAEKFDPDGDYVRQWIPEISRLPNKFIHAPWTAGPLILSSAGIDLGITYPEPVVDHGIARLRALDAFQKLKEAA